jgi:hypothetical protein
LASFPPTEFGDALTIDLGAVGVAQGDETETIAIAIGPAVVRGLGDMSTHGAFALGASDVVSGDPGLVISGERGRSYGREWAAVLLEGSWEPEPAEPQVYDADGKELELRHVEVGYTKDLAGNVRPGETSIAAYFDGSSNLNQVTIILGPQTVVDAAPHSVTLDPQP